MSALLEKVTEPRRQAVAEALRTAGLDPATDARPLGGGASGAAIWQFVAGGRGYVLRLEPDRIALRNRKRAVAAMAAAAQVGAAPPVRYADPVAGVVIMDLIVGRPHPAGPVGLARDLGALTARLREAEPFPSLGGGFLDVIEVLLATIARSPLYALGELEPLAEGLTTIRGGLPWDGARVAASHNDPNPRNILYDGVRPWLIDWELAFTNDPFVDLAILSLETCAAPALEAALLAAALGRPAGDHEHARLAIMRLLARLFYGVVALEPFTSARIAEPMRLDRAKSPEAFVASVREGRVAGEAISFEFGAMSLKAFRDGMRSAGVAEILARGGVLTYLPRPRAAWVCVPRKDRAWREWRWR